MNINEQDFKIIQSLVGQEITQENLKFVDFYISEKLSIFIPSIGFCEYAIKPNHTHPSYSFTIFFSDEQKIVNSNIDIPNDHYLLTCMSPEIPHEEKVSDNFNRYIAIFIDKDFFNFNLSMYMHKEVPCYFWDTFTIHKNILFFINKFMTEYEEKNYGSINMLNSLAEIITNELIRCTLEMKQPNYSNLKTNDIHSIIHYINQHFSEKITTYSLKCKKIS